MSFALTGGLLSWASISGVLLFSAASTLLRVLSVSRCASVGIASGAVASALLVGVGAMHPIPKVAVGAVVKCFESGGIIFAFLLLIL